MRRNILVDWTTYVLTEDWINALKIGLKILHDKNLESKKGIYLEQIHTLIREKLNKKFLLPIDFFDLSEEEQAEVIEEASESIITGKPMPVRNKELDDLTVEWTSLMLQDDYMGTLKTGLKILHQYKTKIGQSIWCDNLFNLIEKKLKRKDLLPSGDFYYKPIEYKVNVIEKATQKILEDPLVKFL